MNESQRIANQLHRALSGGVNGVPDAWHGPSWGEVLEGVTREAATHRPIPDAHTIAEIVMHAAAWHDIVRQRLEGQSPEVTDSTNWPPAAFTDETQWSAAVERLFTTGAALEKTIEDFPEKRLHEKRPSVDGTWYELIIGGLQHVLYHAGQVGVLRKAQARVSV
jgi:hypothetical protein